MNINLFTLKFSGKDADLEKPFVKNFNDGSRMQLRIALILAIVLIALFGILDRLLVPSQILFTWFIRFALLCPAILCGVALTCRPNATIFFPWMQIALINIVGAGFMGMILTSPSPINHLYYSGLILVLMYGYTFVRLRFIWATLSGWLLVSMYEIVAWCFTNTEKTILLSNTFFLVTANCIGMVACYTIERNQRKGFYLAHQWQKEEIKVVAVNSLLEQRVADRTAELVSLNKELERQILERKSLEEQTRQAQKMESIGLLAGGVAHDFNNILTVIVGNAGLLKMSEPSVGKIAQHVGAITTASQRGAQLVRQLLTFARKTEPCYGPVDINGVVSEVAGLLRETFSKEIAIKSQLSSELPFINADNGQIHQVLMNICINARDAMPCGGTLTLKTGIMQGTHVRMISPKAMAEKYVYMSIADTGFGMDALTQAKIFEPFFTTKETGKGTGLGLSVVYGIVESHHGVVQVRSAPDEGTEFLVFMPMSVGQDSVVATSHNEPGFARGSGETILIIDDEKSILDFLSELLRQRGFTVLAAESGKEGISLYQEYKDSIVLVISDKGMPHMDGEKVFRAIRDINPSVRFILLTGLIDSVDKHAYIKNGMANVLLKPIEPEDLLAVIGRAI